MLEAWPDGARVADIFPLLAVSTFLTSELVECGLNVQAAGSSLQVQALGELMTAQPPARLRTCSFQQDGPAAMQLVESLVNVIALRKPDAARSTWRTSGKQLALANSSTSGIGKAAAAMA